MTRTVRTDSDNRDFKELVQLLDKDLAIRDGSEHSFYAQYNKIDMIRHVVIVYVDEQAVSCGAIKEYSPRVTEIKRMFTLPAHRGKGLAGVVLAELEKWAAEMSYEKCILETGKAQPEAIALYTKSGFSIITNYGQYAGIENSVCFEKILG